MTSSDGREPADRRLSQRQPRTSQLRDDIDSGRTGDKVPAPDPSAAPLGTDDEAGGTPADGARTRLAAQQRVGGEAPRRPGLAEGRRRRRPGKAALAVAAGGIITVILLVLWGVGA